MHTLKLPHAKCMFDINFTIGQKTSLTVYCAPPNYTANEVPQPQVLLAFGFLNTKPRAFNPS